MIGIDIGSYSIKICQIDIRGGVVYDVNMAIKDLPEPQRGESREKAIARVIKGILKEYKFNTNKVATALNSSETVIRRLDFPPIPQSELKSVIKLQAEKYIFSDLSEMEVDFHILNSQQDKMEVLLIASPETTIDDTMKLIYDSALDLQVVDVNNLALANCFMTFDPNPGEKEVIVLDIGHTKTNFTILSNGRFCYAKCIEFGGKNITSEIERELEITSEKAEEIKISEQLWDEIGLNIKNVLRRTTPDLLEALYRAIEFSQNQSLITTVDNILLTGGTSLLPGIDKFLSEILGIECVIWNPLANVEINQEKEIGQFLSIALGLAVRKEVNV